MRRSLPLVLLLLVGALAIAFWPDDASDALNTNEGNTASAIEDDPDLAQVDGEQTLPAAPETNEETPSQRVEEQVDAESATSEQSDPYAEDVGRVLVRVRDGEGNPMPSVIAGALVVPDLDPDDLTNLQELFFAAQGVPTDGFPVREVRANESGEAVLSVPSGRMLAIYARALRHRIALDTTELSSSANQDSAPTEVELVVVPGGFLEITVTDETGKAVQGAAVVLTVSGRTQSGEIPIQFLLSDEAGKATFAHLSFDSYQLEVVKEGHQYHRQLDVAITSRGDAYIDVTIGRGTPLRGTVVDANGSAAAGVSISLQAKDRKDRPQDLPALLLGTRLLSATTDEFGRFEISGLYDSVDYSLRADPSRGLPHSGELVRAGDEVYIELPPTAFVSGQLVDAEQSPVDGARILFTSDEVGQHGNPARTPGSQAGTDGHFEVMMQPGDYRWFAASNSGEAQSSGLIGCYGDVDLGALTLNPGGSWKIRVLQPDGSAARRVALERFKQVDAANPLEAAIFAGLRRQHDSSRFRNGELSRSGLAPGRYSARLGIRGYLDAEVETLVSAGQEVETVVTATQAGEIQFTIRDAQGQPVNRNFVLEHVGALPDQWSHLDQRIKVDTNASGRDRVSGILPGRWALRAEKAGGPVYGEYQVAAGQQPIEVSLPAE